MSGIPRIYQTSSLPDQIRESSGDLVLAEIEDTQLPVTGNVIFLPTESAGQPLLDGLIRRAESRGPVFPGVEMSPPGDTPFSGGTRDCEFTLPRVI